MDLHNNGIFEERIHPSTDVKSYCVRRPERWCLQSFYFTNISLSLDARYLWCYCMQELVSPKQLAVVDLAAGTTRIIENSIFDDASPMLDEQTGMMYWIGGKGGAQLCRCGPESDSEIEVLNEFPEELIRGRRIQRIATHLTLTANRTAVCFDAEVEAEWCAGLMPLNGDPIQIWSQFDVCYNHAQCNPSDNDQMLIAQDFWNDPVTGVRHPYVQRIWLLNKDGSRAPIFKEETQRHGHEWWSADGRGIWFVHYSHGVCRYDVASKRVERNWGGHVLHAHCNKEESLIVGDTYYKLGADEYMGVLAFDRASRIEVAIALDNKLPSAKGHLHPHPQFSHCGEYIMYTTFNDDKTTTIAVTPVSEIRDYVARYCKNTGAESVKTVRAKSA